jgi:hypothetical protein
MASRAVAIALLLVALVGSACRQPRAKLPWGIGVATFDATALGLARTRTPDPFVDAIRPGRLVIPTYDGSNQATHPDVLVERSPSGAVHVTMAMTPYPFSNGRLENPSLVVSSDGMTFAPAPGAPTPLVPAPPYDHNDDPDLRRDPRTGEYELLYLESMRPQHQTLVALRSKDKVTWTRRDAIFYDFTKPSPFIVSPAAIDDGGKTYLFYVETVTSQIGRLVSNDGIAWDPAGAAPVAIDLGAIKPWHVDVFRGDGAFGMLISGFDVAFAHQNLYLATSPDLVTWTLRKEPLLAWNDPALGVDTLYRSSGVVDHGTLIVWYSMQYP